MPDYPMTRPFTAEKRRRQGPIEMPLPGGDAPAPALPAAIAGAGGGATGLGGPTGDCPGEAGCRSHADLVRLQGELQHLKDAIDHMKLEIAALRHDAAPPAPWERATSELDAVVQSTESATHTILESAERINTLLGDARTLPPAAAAAVFDTLNDEVIHIFEACNFQDITGQRINKVVGAMKFIETRIERMIEILGGQEALRSVEVVADEPDEDARLLAGPQLDGEAKISQNDIDRFFD